MKILDKKCLGDAPSCPNLNLCLNPPSSKKHIIIGMAEENEARKFLSSFIGKRTIKKLLDADTGILQLYKCNCGLIFGVTAEGKTVKIIKFEVQ